MFLRSLSRFHSSVFSLCLETLFLEFGRAGDGYSNTRDSREMLSLETCHATELCSCLQMQWRRVEQEADEKTEIQRLSAEHLFQQPSCEPSPGPLNLHLLWEVNCSPGGMPTCQLTVGYVPPRRRADTFWHRPLEHFFNLMAEQDLRWRDEETEEGGKSHGRCWTQASARESRSRLEQASDGVCHRGRRATGTGASLCLSGLASPWQEFWKTRHPKSDTFPYIPLPPLPPATYVWLIDRLPKL